MKKTTIFLILILILVSFFCGCTENTSSPWESAYINFCELGKTDMNAALNQYCYYESPQIKEYALAANEQFISYRINSWEQLSDSLWVVSTSLETRYHPDGQDVYNYVAKIKNTYYVILSYDQIPDDIRNSIDLSSYIPTGEHVIYP